MPGTRILSNSPLFADHHGAPPPRAARLVFSILGRLKGGRLAIDCPDGQRREFGDSHGPHVRLTVADWSVFTACLAHGDIGFARTRMDERWHCDQPAALVELFCRNRDAMERAIHGSLAGRIAWRLKHLFNRNTRSGSRRNIEAHYDLGNDFYALWLDPSMTYSSALFAGDRSLPLEIAQRAKYRRILDHLRPVAGEHILEIGCGWGAFAEMAVHETGASVTGLTLSHQQLAYAQQRLARLPEGARAGIHLTDYRDAHGQFDHIVSIEMFEAVGETYWDAWFECVRSRLAPGGRALVQSIVIDDALFERYRAGTDFIQQYIFPGGMLPSTRVFRERARRAGLTVTDEFRFGRDYAETLARWREAFMARLPEVRALGFDERFIRLWEFYLAYCEGAFNAGSTDVVQFGLAHAPAA
jgi:cyclopropane-fatty-acyl-phospholipid synthase